jgi:N-methylhydantoinase A
MMLGADVGGTFTDLVLVEGGSITTSKVPTTSVQSHGIAVGAAKISQNQPISTFIHGTTVATNTLLERKGASTSLITDEGFEDIIEIGRQDRSSLYDSYHDRPEPLVRRADRFGVTTTPTVMPTTESIAVSLVNGHAEPERERAIHDALRAEGFAGPISLSSVVAPEFREYERTSTTVLNAYLTPSSERYLVDLAEALVGTGLVGHMAVMRSSGGLISAEDAAALPASILLSGPAGGVAAAAAFATTHGHGRVVSFDMGGTSTDVCRIEDGESDVSYERSIGGYVCRLPAAGIHTVGAGGGSIAWVDPGGSLRVGPHSAGAEPGPACYAKGGTSPTVTDANVVLGRMAPDAELGGSLRVDRSLAVAALAPIASELGMSVDQVALGIIAVAEDVMAGAIRKVSIEEGSDPRGAFLYAFGGAGGLHATSLARSLDMAGVVFPPHGGVFSALGLLLAPPRADIAQSVFLRGDELDALDPILELTESIATQQLNAAGRAVTSVDFVVDVRYLGQAHEIGIPFHRGDDAAAVRARFNDAHRTRNGFERDADPIEIVTVRCTATGDPAMTLRDIPAAATDTRRRITHRPVGTIDGVKDANVVDRTALRPGEQFDGPVVVEADEATMFIGQGESAVVLSDGSIKVTW